MKCTCVWYIVTNLAMLSWRINCALYYFTSYYNLFFARDDKSKSNRKTNKSNYHCWPLQWDWFTKTEHTNTRSEGSHHRPSEFPQGCLPLDYSRRHQLWVETPQAKMHCLFTSVGILKHDWCDGHRSNIKQQSNELREEDLMELLIKGQDRLR